MADAYLKITGWYYNPENISGFGWRPAEPL
jgi:hypothetical protein